MSRSFSHSPIDFRSMPGPIKGLVVANVAAFVLSQLVGPDFYTLFGLVPAKVIGDRYVWQVVTYLFIHGSLMHLLFNLFSLWMFGMPVQAQWGSTEFLKYYFICGVGAALCSVALSPHSPYPIIGASGAVYGLLVAFAMLYPDAVVYLYFFLPIKAAHMAILFGLIEFFAGTANTSPGIARFAHLGGMAVGYLYIRWWWIAKIKAKGLWAEMTRSSVPTARAKPARRPGRVEAPEPVDPMAEVDRILDKISEHGKDSLSEAEREVLRRHSDQQRRKDPNGHA